VNVALLRADHVRTANVGKAHWTVRKSACGWEGEMSLNPQKFVINDDEKKKGYMM
jgi:polyisoprenoid-binding protein YceI